MKTVASHIPGMKPHRKLPKYFHWTWTKGKLKSEIICHLVSLFYLVYLVVSTFYSNLYDSKEDVSLLRLRCVHIIVNIKGSLRCVPFQFGCFLLFFCFVFR